MFKITTLLTSIVAVTVTWEPRATDAHPSPNNNLPTLLDARTAVPFTNSTTPKDAGVTLCTLPNFGGECYHSVWPKNSCIDLRGYAGVTQSFLPDAGSDCLLMQNKCDATVPFADISADETVIASNLTVLNWIADSTSYICFSEVVAAKRFVRLARLKAMGGAVRDE